MSIFPQSVDVQGYSGISGFPLAAEPQGDGTAVLRLKLEGAVSGFSGYSGQSGYSGKGESGYSGISGFSGYSGTSGYSGYSGLSGYSGYSGQSGFSGTGKVKNTYRVSESGGDFTTLALAFAYLDTLIGRTDGVRLIVDAGDFTVENTIVIDYDFAVQIEGAGVEVTHFHVGAGLYDADELDDALKSKAMFSVKSETYFNRMHFIGSDVANWWNYSGARFLCFKDAEAPYIEVVDFWMEQAYTGICCETNADVFVFNFTIEKMKMAGVGYNDLSVFEGGSVDVEIGDFDNCVNGVLLHKGVNVDVFINTCRFSNEVGQECVGYNPTDFSYDGFSIVDNDWNRVGIFFDDADFELARDANIEVKDNIRTPDFSPAVKILIDDNTTITDTPSSGVWHKVEVDPTKSSAPLKIKWGTDTNRITYLSDHTKTMRFLLTGNVQSSAQPRTVYLAIVKNGDAVNGRIFQRGLRSTASGVPFIFALSGIDYASKDDYYELYLMSASGGMNWTVTDLDWFVFTSE